MKDTLQECAKVDGLFLCSCVGFAVPELTHKQRPRRRRRIATPKERMRTHQQRCLTFSSSWRQQCNVFSCGFGGHGAGKNTLFGHLFFHLPTCRPRRQSRHMIMPPPRLTSSGIAQLWVKNGAKLLTPCSKKSRCPLSSPKSALTWS